MKNKSWYKIECKNEDAATLCIYDEIGLWGITAQDFVTALDGIKAKTIELRVNSPGGSVFDGITIHNALKRHSATVNVHVDGLAASIASVIAMAGDSVRMAKNSFMMIHNAWVGIAGNAGELVKMAETLSKIDETIVSMYQSKTGAEKADIENMMEAETWLNADEALAKGFCDAIGDPADVQARFDLAKYKNTPQAVVAMNTLGAPPEEDTPHPEEETSPAEENIGTPADNGSEDIVAVSDSNTRDKLRMHLEINLNK